MKRFIYLSLIFLIGLTSCKKSKFLETKPNAALVLPTTLEDYQAILDNYYVMNGLSNGQGAVPFMGESGSDNFYIPDDLYNSSLTGFYRNCYIWNKDIYTGEPVYDWSIPYQIIFYCNIVLDGISKIDVKNTQEKEYDNILGSALFYRAHMFYQLAQIFSPAYDSASPNQLGIPLRLTPNMNEEIHRSTLKQTYDKIITDLEKSRNLLPVSSLYKTRPSVTTVYGLFARIYQTLGNYDKAFLYADSALQQQNTLLDYNACDTTATNWFPFDKFNGEVIFAINSLGLGESSISFITAVVDSSLYASYDNNDLRKILYFKPYDGYMRFFGSYSSFSNVYFCGIAVDEMYLIRAECNARKGNTVAAMNDLNTLLKKRWKAGTFIPFTVNTPQEALNKILDERRKELIFRGLRWTDLRRLNKEGDNITIVRKVNGQMYTLSPNDNRYTYPIPPSVINFNSGLQQNIR